jgi:uncharacterized membrane-anchored protein
MMLAILLDFIVNHRELGCTDPGELPRPRPDNRHPVFPIGNGTEGWDRATDFSIL